MRAHRVATAAVATVGLLFANVVVGAGLAGVVAATASAQASTQIRTQRAVVRGVVFDSLTMAPVPKATVWLPGGTQTTNADDNGRFELDDVPRGKQFLAFSTPGLDSLGLGTLGTQVDITGDGLPVRLTTPSFRTVWQLLCANAVRASSADSGIVWGTVRDAKTDVRLSGAATGFMWYDLRTGADKKLQFREITHETRTDSTGHYYACGLPSDIKITSEATGTKSASGTLEYLIGERRLFRVDLLVSTDMVFANAADVSTLNADSVSRLRAVGSATLSGTVRDTKGKPVANAAVSIASVDTTVRTNADGKFQLTRLPAGSHVLQAKLLGFAPATQLVELRPEQTTSALLEMPDARALETVNVRAERVPGIDQVAFNDRRKINTGFALTEKDFAGRHDIMGMLAGLPRVEPIRGRGPAMIGIRNRRGGVCMPTVYLDGTLAATDQITMYQPSEFRAVEVYNTEFNAPIGFDAKGCGVILFWSKKNPRW